jgi:RNase P protein component
MLPRGGDRVVSGGRGFAGWPGVRMALTLRRRAGYPPAFVNLRVAPASVRLRDLVPLLSVLIGWSPVEGESGSKASVLRGSGAGMRPDPRRGNGVDEADLSAESDPSQASTWLPREDEYTCGADDPEAEAREGSKAPRGGEALEVAGEGRQRALWTSRSAPVSTGLPARVGDRSESRVSVLRRARESGKSGRRRGFPVPTGTDGECGAVARNRIKRQVREWFRWEGRRTIVAADIVVIARRGAATLSARAVKEELRVLLRSALERQ